MLDAKAFGQEIAAMVRAHVAERIEPLEQRIGELEAARLAFKGVWQASTIYRRGDLATREGAIWHCNRDGTSDRPGDGTGWQMAVKQGAAK